MICGPATLNLSPALLRQALGAPWIVLRVESSDEKPKGPTPTFYPIHGQPNHTRTTTVRHLVRPSHQTRR